MEDEIYLRHTIYHQLLAEGYTKEDAALMLEGPGWEKMKRMGAMGLAGLASMTATPDQANAAPPTEARQEAKHNYGSIMGHKVHYAGKATDRGREIQMVVVAVRGKSQRDISMAQMAARSGIGQMVTGKKNYKTNLTGVFVSYKNVKGYGLVAIAKYDPQAGQEMRDLMGQDRGSEGGSGVSGKYQGGVVGNRPSPDDIDDF